MILVLAILTSLSASADAAPAPRSQFEKMTICECAAKKVCWKLAMTVYQTNVGLAMTEIEAALPGRFFAGTEVSALRKPDGGGHFLRVVCGPERSPCEDKRGELEKRVVLSRFLSAFPESKKDVLFDPKTWAITDLGEKTVADVRARCKPGLFAELSEGLMRSFDR